MCMYVTLCVCAAYCAWLNMFFWGHGHSFDTIKGKKDLLWCLMYLKRSKCDTRRATLQSLNRRLQDAPNEPYLWFSILVFFVCCQQYKVDQQPDWAHEPLHVGGSVTQGNQNHFTQQFITFQTFLVISKVSFTSEALLTDYAEMWLFTCVQSFVNCSFAFRAKSAGQVLQMYGFSPVCSLS